MKFLCLVFMLVFGSLATAGDLEGMYKSKEIKEISSKDFVGKFPNFRWQGENKRVAISNSSMLLDYKVREAIAYFNADGKLTRLDSWVYNRGDDGPMNKEKFELTYETLIKELGESFDEKPKRKPIDGAVRAEAYAFEIDTKHVVKLLVGYEKRPYRADFLNLVLRNYSDKDRLRGSEAKKYVTKRDNGDVVIARIPMIDQGPKGYCVPATLARIGQHFGVDVSMHEIAMISDSTSGGGTYVGQAMDSLKKKYGRIMLRIKDVKVKNPLDLYIRRGSTLYPTSATAAKAAFDALKDDDRNYKTFFKNIKKMIDKGYIVAWSMVVGLLPENGEPARQSGGGHMRMIIGYNEKTQEIVFSDSWGNGHEEKRMAGKAALLVTNGLYEIVP
ncbi:MAG: C39 family peptidase [Lentisphaeraceae bacterium]|nr:C39 family peptidase [Lentisphaeraceae bacterium]